VARAAGSGGGGGYTGAELLAIHRGDWAADGALAAARRLFRSVIDHHLEGRPLQTRAVYAALRRQPAKR
jgi:recombinational DNA repair protein (RecF pathway)